MTTTTVERPKHPDTVAAIDAGTRFANDVDEHVLTVKHDDGLYRHLLFRSPKTMGYWFEIITWPGCLTLAGDMGTYTFRRTEDMLTFFRGNSRPIGSDYRINPSYWAEKIQNGSSGGRRAVQEYDERRLTDHLRTVVTERAEDNDWPAEVLADALFALKADLTDHFSTFENEDLENARDYEWSVTRRPTEATAARELLGSDVGETYKVSFSWDDVYDAGPFHGYSYHFLWACHAIVWGIEQYDEAKKPAEALWPQDDAPGA